MSCIVTFWYLGLHFQQMRETQKRGKPPGGGINF